MANLNGFDASQVEPADDLEPIPAGNYCAVIVESEMKPTKSGTGSYLELKFQIIEGQYTGRLLWTRLNLDNPNDTAVHMARRELSAICRAVGVMAPKDSSELHNLPCMVHVRVRKRGDTGELQNEIKGYAPRSSKPATVASSAAGAPASAPWKR